MHTLKFHWNLGGVGVVEKLKVNQFFQNLLDSSFSPSLQLDLVQLELCTRCLAQASELVTQK